MPTIGSVDPQASLLGSLSGARTLGAAGQRFGDVLANTLQTNPTAGAPSLTTGPSAAAEGGAFTGLAPAAGQPVADLVGTLSNAVNNRISEVQTSEQIAQQSKQTLLSGGDIELHDVILASERARLELQLTMQVRNKLLEAYQELMRTPV